jgi:hypothetical protein
MKKEPTKPEAPAVTSPAHTPGPWKMSGSTTAVYRAVQDGNWAGHSDLNEPIAWLTDTGRNAEETEANARLIAAAPELLAALKKIDANAAESPEWIRRVARKARRKAEGRAE